MPRPTSACVGLPWRGRPSSPPGASCPFTRGSIGTCWMIDVLRVIRAHNLLVAAAGVLAGGWIALGALATPKLLLFAAVAAVGFGAAGNAVNDIWDAAADRVNRGPSGRPLAAGRLARGTADLCVVDGTLVGLGAAALVSGTALFVGLGALGVMMLYSPVLNTRRFAVNTALTLAAGRPTLSRTPQR